MIGRYAVADGQVYVAGMSAGGTMAAIMGTLYPDLYAAVGVHSGLPFACAHDLPSVMAAMKGSATRGRNVGSSLPVIMFHGDRDQVVHPGNADAVMARHAQRATGAAVLESGQVRAGHAYTCSVHRHTDGAPQAEQWLIHGAGHA